MTGQTPTGLKAMAHKFISAALWAKRDVCMFAVNGAIAFQSTDTGWSSQVPATPGTYTLVPDYVPNDMALAVADWRLHITGAVFTGSYTFTVSSANATAGATYTNNSVTFTVVGTISGGTTLVCTGASAPAASGTLTKTGGTGDSTITFSAFATNSTLTLQYSDGTIIAVINLVTAFTGAGSAAPSAAGTVVQPWSTGVTLWTGFDPANAPKGKGIQAVVGPCGAGSAINVVLESVGVL